MYGLSQNDHDGGAGHDGGHIMAGNTIGYSGAGALGHSGAANGAGGTGEGIGLGHLGKTKRDAGSKPNPTAVDCNATRGFSSARRCTTVGLLDPGTQLSMSITRSLCGRPFFW